MRKLGFEAFSCDTQDCSGKNPQWHIKGDLLEVIKNNSYYNFDCIIAFPPCTHLANSGAAWFEQKRKDGRQQQAVNFFLEIANCDIKYIAIENPLGVMSNIFKKPTQIIQPYFFGDEFQKSTCLWLKNLPMLYHNDKPNLFDSEVTHVDRGEFYYFVGRNGKVRRSPIWFNKATNNKKTQSSVRSKTFPGIAKQMALQWSKFIVENENKKALEIF